MEYANIIKQGAAEMLLDEIPDGAVSLIILDPPYNIGVTQGEKATVQEWDVVEEYEEKVIYWIKKCARKLKGNGVLYLWHNDPKQFPRILCDIERETELRLQSMCIWDKGDTYRAQSWKDRKAGGKTALRSWFSVCEYCFRFFKAPRQADGAWGQTGLARVYSNPECFKPLKDWYRAELARLKIGKKDIAEAYQKALGKRPYMLRHYFQDSQFEIPTRKVWEAVYMPLGFAKEYEALRKEYEALRNTHHVDPMHCNIWHVPPLPSAGRLHTCQKPEQIIRRLIRVSSNPGDIVLDPFMGSGTTCAAAIREGRKYIGFEKEEKYFRTAAERIEKAEEERYEEQNLSGDGTADGRGAAGGGQPQSAAGARSGTPGGSRPVL